MSTQTIQISSGEPETCRLVDPQRRRASRQTRRYADALLALSLANLCYLKLWAALLAYSMAEMFFMKAAPSKVTILAAMTNTVVMAAALWFAIRVARNTKSGGWQRVAKGILLVTALVFANSFRETLSSLFPLPFLRFQLFTLLGRNATVAVVAGIILMIVVAGVRHARSLAEWLVPPLYICSVFFPLTVGYAVWTLTQDNSRAFPAAILASRVIPASRARVTWIIFDEWDQRLTFAARPAGLQLPEIDRFRESAVLAENALPPAGETALSIPSLLAGKIVKAARPVSSDNLQIVFSGSSEWVRWGTEPNVITRARQGGFNVGVVGWYLPYCRVFADTLSECSWVDLPLQSNSLGVEFLQIVPNQMRSLLETNLLSPFGQSLAVGSQARRYQDALAQAAKVVVDPAIGLAIIHLPAAHVPYFYDRRTGQPTAGNELVSGYPNGLALADSTLGIIRKTMQEHHLWDDSTVLLTSDHWFRQSQTFDGKTDHRVPFLLKLAGQHAAIPYEPSFNTVLSADLLWATITGELSRACDVPGWIDRHRITSRD